MREKLIAILYVFMNDDEFEALSVDAHIAFRQSIYKDIYTVLESLFMCRDITL